MSTERKGFTQSTPVKSERPHRYTTNGQQPPSASNRSPLIKGGFSLNTLQQLQVNNERLAQQIARARSVLNCKKEQPPSLRKGRSTSELMQSQMNNVNKLIGNYNNEIRSLSEQQAQGTAAQRIQHLTDSLRAATTRQSQVRAQLNALQKYCAKLQRKDEKKEQPQKKVVLLLQEKSVMKEKVKQAEMKAAQRQHNLKQQKTYIDSLQLNTANNKESPKEKMREQSGRKSIGAVLVEGKVVVVEGKEVSAVHKSMTKEYESNTEAIRRYKAICSDMQKKIKGLQEAEQLQQTEIELRVRAKEIEVNQLEEFITLMRRH